VTGASGGSAAGSRAAASRPSGHGTRSGRCRPRHRPARRSWRPRGGVCSVRPARPSSVTKQDRPVGGRGLATTCANARTRKAWLCFIDESAVKLTPPVRRTWALKGQTPVLRHHPYRRGKQLSMCGMVAYRPDEGSGEPAAWMGFDLLEGAYDTRQFIRVLDAPGSQLDHQPVTVMGQPGRPSRRRPACLGGDPTVVGACVPALLRAGTQPGGGAVGQPQGLRVGQPLLRWPRRADRHRPGRLHPCASSPGVAAQRAARTGLTL
jgi:hypothetical protein